MKKFIQCAIVSSILMMSSINTVYAETNIYSDSVYQEYQKQLDSGEYYEGVEGRVVQKNTKASGSSGVYRWELVKFGSGEVYSTSSASTDIDSMSVGLTTYAGSSIMFNKFKPSPSGWTVAAISLTDKDDVYRRSSASGQYHFNDSRYGSYQKTGVTESWSY